MPVVRWSSAAAASPRDCFTSNRAMALAPASASAWDMFQPRPLAPLEETFLLADRSFAWSEREAMHCNSPL